MEVCADTWMLPAEPRLELLLDAAETVCDQWPEAVVHDCISGECAHEVDALVPTEQSELCVYASIDVARSWLKGEVGRPPANSMIQFRLARLGLECVADDWRDTAMSSIMAALCRHREPSGA